MGQTKAIAPHNTGARMKHSKRLSAIFLALIAALVLFACEIDDALEEQNNLPDASESSLKNRRVNTAYSPDGKYLIEGYGLNENAFAGGSFASEEIHLVEISLDKTVWNMTPGYYDPQFLWSPDGRFVSVAYSGRTYTLALILDTEDFSEQHLPGSELLLPFFPEAIPDDNRPDPYTVPQKWLSNNTILVSFQWTVKDTGEPITGEYIYDVYNGKFTLE